VSHSWRTNASFFIRATLPGIVEYLFPLDGILRAGQSLARVYNIGNMTDWEKVQQLLTAAGASPYLIAGRGPTPNVYFPSAMLPVSGRPLIGLPVYSAPAAAPAIAPRSRATLARAPAAPSEAPASRAKLASAPASETTEEEVVSYETVPASESPDSSAARVRAQSAVADADKQVEEARSLVHSAEEDLAARDRLYQKGIIARREVEDARERLDETRKGLSQRESYLSQAKAELRQAQETPAPATVTRRVVRRVSVPRPAQQPDASVAYSAPQPAAAPPARLAASPAPASQSAAADRSSRVVWPAPLVSSGRAPRRQSGGAPMTPLSPVANQLAQVQWADQQAPSDGMVIRTVSPNGALVQAGDPLVELANTEWVRLYADIDLKDVPRFRPGTPVGVTFDEYPGTRFAGWVGDVAPQKGESGARAELIVFCEQGLYRNDARYTIEWLALASPVEDEAASKRPHLLEQSPEGARRRAALTELFPLAPEPVISEVAGAGASIESQAPVYTGSLKLGEMPRSTGAVTGGDSNIAQKRLAALRVWRDAFTRGMTTTSLAPGVSVTYPRDGDANYAIDRMLRGAVSHVPDRCAGTMREALGWGLGDAHVWAYELPAVGYAARPAGLARPGDILVWPFTYGPRSSQHIGFAVQQNGRLMLLSNLGGNLGTTEILPGFIAYYRPVIASAGTEQRAR
jgi:hypothetical protein